MDHSHHLQTLSQMNRFFVQTKILGSYGDGRDAWWSGGTLVSRKSWAPLSSLTQQWALEDEEEQGGRGGNSGT